LAQGSITIINGELGTKDVAVHREEIYDRIRDEESVVSIELEANANHS